MLSTSARVIARVRPRIAHRRVQHRLRPVFGVLHKLGLPVSAGVEMERWEELWAHGLDPGDAFDCEKNEPAFQDLIDKVETRSSLDIYWSPTLRRLICLGV